MRPPVPRSAPAPLPAGPSPGRQLARILSFARPHRWAIGGGVLVFLAATGVSLLLPLGIRILLDTALKGSDPSLLNLLTLGLLGLFVLRLGLGFLGSFVLLVTGEKIVIGLRTRLYGHLQGLDIRFFRDQRVGDLASRLTSDAASIRNAVTETLVSALIQLFQVIGSLAIMLYLNWRLALVVLLAAPATSLVSRAFAPTLRRIARRVQEQTGATAAVVQETLSGIQVVKAFARGAFETSRYGGALRRLFEISRRSALINSWFRSIVSFVAAAATIALFWFGGLEVIAGRLTAGDLVAFLFYSQTIGQGLALLAQQYGEIMLVIGASERVFEILDLRPVVVEAPDARALPSVRGRVAFDDVSFGYQTGQTVLAGISLDVEPGETVALVGPSGTGKSTLLHLVHRFFDPTAGRVLLDGHDLRGLKLDWLREQVAFVPQDTFLFGTSVRENIRYGRPDATDAEIEAAARAANAEEFILQLDAGYDTEIGERGVRLSGGQCQRLAIARAILKDAPVLVLDEATSAVDAVSEKLIQEALEKLRRGRTTLIVAHRLGTVADADRILVLQGGRIVQTGTHERLIGVTGPYRELVRTQLQSSPSVAATG